MRECIKISINGVSLHRPDKWLLTVATQGKSVPRFKQVVSEIPGMDGAIVPDVLRLEAGTLPVGVKLKGRDAAENRALHDELVRALYGRGQLVQIDLEGADGLVRRNYGRADQSSLNELAATLADARVEYYLPDPVWRSPARSWLPVAHSGATVELEELKGGTGPVSYVLALSGPGTGVRVTDVESGEVTLWAGERDQARVLLIDGWRAGEYSSRPASPSVAGNAARSSEVESAGRIWTDVQGRYRVKVEVTGAGVGTSVALFAGRAWL